MVQLQTVLLCVLGAIFSTFGGAACKQWAIGKSAWFIALGGVFYGIDAYIWANILRRNSSMSVAGAIWLAISLILTVLYSFFVHHDRPSTIQWCGGILVLVGAILVSYKP